MVHNALVRPGDYLTSGAHAILRSKRGGGGEFLISSLLARIHLIIVMIRWTGRASRDFEFSFPCSLASTFLERARNEGSLKHHLYKEPQAELVTGETYPLFGIMIDSGLFGSTDWERYQKSRRCSRDTYAELHNTKCTSIRILKVG
jgi:hypothetical protein